MGFTEHQKEILIQLAKGEILLLKEEQPPDVWRDRRMQDLKTIIYKLEL